MSIPKIFVLVSLQFRTCIGTLGVNLTEAETLELINRYRCENQPGLINYRDFIVKLDEVFLEQMNPTEVIMNARTTAVSYKNGFNRHICRLIGY